MTNATITTAVVLARGLGKRMRAQDGAAMLDGSQSAAADAGMKSMVPVGRPFLDYVLSVLADAGFLRACLVIGPEHHAVRKYYTGVRVPQRIGVEFAVQAEPLGTANAVLAAEAFGGKYEFLVINGDNYYPLDVLREIQGLGNPGTVLFESESLVRESNIPRERVQAFATCVVDNEGYLVDIVEKPGEGQMRAAKLISMNCWRFGPEIFAACRDVVISPRGEFELPVAVKLAIGRGVRFKTVVSRSGVLDLSRRSDIEAVAERLKHARVAL